MESRSCWLRTLCQGSLTFFTTMFSLNEFNKNKDLENRNKSTVVTSINELRDRLPLNTSSWNNMKVSTNFVNPVLTHAVYSPSCCKCYYIQAPFVPDSIHSFRIKMLHNEGDSTYTIILQKTIFSFCCRVFGWYLKMFSRRVFAFQSQSTLMQNATTNFD